MNSHSTLTQSIRIIEVALYKAVEALNQDSILGSCYDVNEFMVYACEELGIDPDGFNWIRLDE